MNQKGKIIGFTSVFLFIMIICLFCCCAPKDPADIARKVAEEWASNNVDDVSRSVAGLIVDSSPLFEKAVAMAIEKAINQRIAWEYSHPKKLAEERYEVVTTAYAEIEFPLLGSYRVSVNYDLEIDTRQKQVISADMDVGSFALRKQ